MQQTRKHTHLSVEVRPPSLKKSEYFEKQKQQQDNEDTHEHHVVPHDNDGPFFFAELTLNQLHLTVQEFDEQLYLLFTVKRLLPRRLPSVS